MKNIKKLSPLLILILIEAFLFAVNFKPGTYFLGWDSLFPEMNFPANISRSFLGVWQEYRGLGLLDGMSYTANLPHYLFLWLASLVLPQNLLRYFFFFLMHLVGGVGMYLFLTQELVKRPLAAFFGALFYMFNLATIQMFFAPYELFAVHFAFLPWLVWFVLNYLRTGGRKVLSLFFLFSLAAVPQAHVPTVFLVYLLTLATIFLFSRNWKRVISIGLVIFCTNAFWLLPYGYNVLRGGANTVIDAKINQMSRMDIYANQKARGDIVNVLTLKGFLLDASELDKDVKKTDFIMSSWRQHGDLLPIEIISGIFLLLAVSGLIVILRNREKRMYPFLAISFGAFFFLASNTPVFDFLNNSLRDNISLIGEGFRFSFTKFSIIFVFTYTVFIVYGIEQFIKKGLFKMLLIVLLAVYAWPAFRGNFFFDALRIQIPGEYSQTVQYFKSQPTDTRIGLFPQPSYWSWRFYNFGYRGSGFLWYGIPQPTMDLAFDPWSRENENYYWEISQAVYSKNLPLFESVLEKYRVNWLLVDENIIEPSSPKALYTDEVEELASKSNSISLRQTFGKIKIYSMSLRVPEKSFVSIASGLPAVNSYKWGNLDQAFFDMGDYKNGTDYIYSYRTLFTGRSQANLEFDPEKLILGEPIITFAGAAPAKLNLTKSYPGLSHRDGYLIKITAKNIGGKPFLFWIEDLNSRRSALESYLPVSSIQSTSYYVLPPMEPDGLGYSFHLDSNTIGKEVSKNELESVAVYKIDYWGMVTQVKSEKFKVKNQSTTYLLSEKFSVDHPNPAFYRIDTDTKESATLILAQSFDSGWVAIGAKNHTLIDNWANGWEVEPGTRTIYLFYWPQLLEFAGFGLLGLLAACLLTRPVVWDRMGNRGMVVGQATVPRFEDGVGS